MHVKGSKAELLQSVHFPSYIQGMLILKRHMDICRQDRKTRAFDSLDQLAYRGDVQKYQVDAAVKIRELLEDNATIMDYIFMMIMESFEGKSKVVQHIKGSG